MQFHKYDVVIVGVGGAGACPRGIQVTKAIQEVKRALLFKRV